MGNIKGRGDEMMGAFNISSAGKALPKKRKRQATEEGSPARLSSQMRKGRGGRGGPSRA